MNTVVNTAISIRHGVVIREHKHWNTKTVYNHGHVMHIYRRQPKTIQFRSPMVNDFNQHLCGGWNFADIPDNRAATVEQLVAGRKPLACITYFDYEADQAGECHSRLSNAGLVSQLQQRDWNRCNSDHVWDVTACHDIRVRDIGNLHALNEDYGQILPMGFEEEMATYSDIPLREFFNGWDSPPLPLWLAGLILGYPVENTISLYLQ